MRFFRESMRYIDFDLKNPRCIHCYINDRAYASVITEVMTNGQDETGGVFLGYIINRAWYIVESVDPGLDTVNQRTFFQWDTDYVNHQAERLSRIYQRPLTILGFWHRHPGSMDYFSGQDEATIKINLDELRFGLLSMLVNVDPKLRMTFYYCYGNDIMPIRYDVGNKYFPVELLKYADAKELSRRAALNGRPLEIYYQQVIDLDAVAARKRAQAQAQSPNPAQNPNSGTASGRATDDLVRMLVERVSDLSSKMDMILKQMNDKPGKQPAGIGDQQFAEAGDRQPAGTADQQPADVEDQRPAAADVHLYSEESGNGGE